MSGSRTYCVYEHIFPNRKRYIGISSDAEKRWRNGKGYETQPKVARAIKKYGWDNIGHNIIVDNVTKEQAEQLERYLIAVTDSIDDGYNTAIGGDNINSTYLCEHILYMIRESKALDEIYGQEQKDDDIVSLFESGKYDAGKAKIFNSIDRIIETEFEDYKLIHSNRVYDGRFERCEAYWYYARKLLEKAVEGNMSDRGEIEDYLRYRSRWWAEKICQREQTNCFR